MPDDKDDDSYVLEDSGETIADIEHEILRTELLEDPSAAGVQHQGTGWGARCLMALAAYCDWYRRAA